MSSKGAPDYDIAIVGGGISGIYTAWRLLTSDLSKSDKLKQWAAARSDGKLRVAVFEGSQRIGGRLLSAQPPGMPSTIVEIGGMRFVSSQELIQSLVLNKLHLKVTQQIVDRDENIAYLRQKRLRTAQLQTPSLLPYDLSWAEQQWLASKNGSASGLIGWAVTKILPEVAKLNGIELRKFLQTAKVDGVELYHHGFWNLLARAMTSEAYQLSRTMVGYDCLGNNANAVDLVTCYFDFTPDVKYFLINNGYETVPWLLQQQFKEAGGLVKCGTWLRTFDAAPLADGSHGVQLSFRDGQSDVTARAIVLAMPTRSLKMLHQTGPVLDPDRSPQFRALLESVEPTPLYKLFIGYRYPWWEACGVKEGRSMTDLPLRQCYYWAENHGPHNTNSVAMIYDDAANVDFWGGLSFNRHHHTSRIQGHENGQPLFERRPMNYADSTAAAETPFHSQMRKNWRDHQAPKLMVEEAHRQLVMMHDCDYAPEPVEAAFMDWSADPYGAGVHLWRRGYKSWVIVNQMTQPETGFPCYVCGEAYSTNQTWAEGALQTAEIMLHKHFHLPKPAWVDGKVTATGASS